MNMRYRISKFWYFKIRLHFEKPLIMDEWNCYFFVILVVLNRNTTSAPFSIWCWHVRTIPYIFILTPSSVQPSLHRVLPSSHGLRSSDFNICNRPWLVESFLLNLLYKSNLIIQRGCRSLRSTHLTIRKYKKQGLHPLCLCECRLNRLFPSFKIWRNASAKSLVSSPWSTITDKVC